MTNEQMQEAIDRFSAAAQGNTADLHDATGALLEAFAARCQQLTTQITLLLVERLEETERQVAALETCLEELRRLHERAVGA